MPQEVNDWLHLIFRWLHIVAGVMWIGHLWFFNFVNSQLVKSYDADSKKKVIPELMPRALYWFRWGAAYTWLTGFLMLGLLYYMGGNLVDTAANGPAAKGLTLGLILVGFFIYDALWKMVKNEMVGGIISFLLLFGTAVGLGRFCSARAVLLFMGAIMGTIMAMNVWMRIWPAQKKIIGGIKGGPAPDASVGAMAGLRSKHNTYMSVPLIFFMASNHFVGAGGNVLPTIGSNTDLMHDMAGPVCAGFILVGWGIAKLMYLKAAQPVTKSIGSGEPPAAAATPPADAAKK
jgi:uncharacterized membrane protein